MPLQYQIYVGECCFNSRTAIITNLQTEFMPTSYTNFQLVTYEINDSIYPIMCCQTVELHYCKQLIKTAHSSETHAYIQYLGHGVESLYMKFEVNVKKLVKQSSIKCWFHLLS
jgi:hypothetical protein